MTEVRGINPVEGYEYLVTAREKLFEWVRPLTLDQYTREFPFGIKSVRNSLVEIAGGEWTYTRRLRGEQMLPEADRPFPPFQKTEFAPLERAWQEQVEVTRRTLSEITDWSKRVEYIAVFPNRPKLRITTTTGGIAMQLLFHEIHHRAQAMAMLRHLGVPAQNLDYSILKFERTEVPA